MHRFQLSFIPLFIACLSTLVLAQDKTKTESFDRDPGWEGVNNRSARKAEPGIIKQDFGFSTTNKAGGARAGEIGGHISPAGEVAYYAMPIETRTLNEPLTASGVFTGDNGGFHVQLGFFNSDTTKEWRTPNTLGLRLQGRGQTFFAYADYCTSKWRAGGQSFTTHPDKTSSRAPATAFPINQPIKWSITYDPKGNDGKGVITAIVGDQTAVCNLDSGHKEDG